MKFTMFITAVVCVSFAECYSASAKGTPTCDVMAEVNSTMAADLTLVHNHFRSREPRASNMLQMVWDDELANIAQEHSNQCRFEHDLVRTCSGSPIGQNIFIRWDYKKYPDFSPLDAVHAWWEERKDYVWSTRKCAPGRMCGHYVQVVKAESRRIGCGVTWCPELLNPRSGRVYKKAVILVCNYGVGNNGENPYNKGKACSNCDEVVNGYYKCQSKLCTPCDPATDNKCDKCAVKTCENGGTFNSATCSCQCTSANYGVTCHKFCACTDHKSWCKYRKELCIDPKYAYFMRKECSGTCLNLCIAPPSGECENKMTTESGIRLLRVNKSQLSKAISNNDN